ncbi:hypothetical protein BD626DRAFT_488062, partial [Schizophyllum amplum]
MALKLVFFRLRMSHAVLGGPIDCAECLATRSRAAHSRLLEHATSPLGSENQTARRRACMTAAQRRRMTHRWKLILCFH